MFHQVRDSFDECITYILNGRIARQLGTIENKGSASESALVTSQ